MLYIGNHLSSSRGFEAMGKTALQLGGNTFAFFTRNPRGGSAKAIDQNDADALNRMLRERHFGTLVAHAPYTLNPCSDKPEVREFAWRIFGEDLERMKMIPGNYYNLHPGSHVGQGKEVGISYIAEMLNRYLSPEQNTCVLLETMSGKGSEIGGSFEELREILDCVECKEKIGICFDTCHVWDAGYNIVENLNGVLNDFDRIIGLEYLKALHVNDSQNPCGVKKDRHAKIGEGYLGECTFCEIVRHPILSKLPMILETPNDDEGWTAEIALLRSWEQV